MEKVRSIDKGQQRIVFFLTVCSPKKKATEDPMKVGAELIGMMNKIANDLTGGSYLLLQSKHMVPEGRPIFSLQVLCSVNS